MNQEPDVSRIASLLADPARALILRTLLDGTMRPAGELAYAAGISAPSARGPLAQPVWCRASASQRRATTPPRAPHHTRARPPPPATQAQGRHRYFRLAAPAVAEVIEL